MIKLLIIADDLTGAMDTGVKLAASGIRTRVTMDTGLQLQEEDDTEVLTICAPTRHLPPQEAYGIIRGIAQRASGLHIPYLFKKTDSALRGNVGAELSALLDGSGGKRLYFLPALPSMNRITEGGVHYIDGRWVSESVFGRDPFDPVKKSFIPDLLRDQTDKKVFLVKRDEQPDFREREDGIYVFDSRTDEDISAHVQNLKSQGELRLIAGCASLAQILPEYLNFETERRTASAGETENPEKLTVICGSVNQISLKQMAFAEAEGCERVHLPVPLLLSEEGFDGEAGRQMCEKLYRAARKPGRCLLIDTQPDGQQAAVPQEDEAELEWKRQRISGRLGSLVKILLDQGTAGRFMIIGGDTLLAFLSGIRCRDLTPVREVFPGVVLFRIRYREKEYEILSKSGGFGPESLLMELQPEAEAREAAV